VVRNRTDRKRKKKKRIGKQEGSAALVAVQQCQQSS
jgi:hypothetical protein